MPKPRDPGRDLRESDGELPPDEPINLKATALFTDREEALAAFRRHAQAPPGRTLPVLSFYGVGGAGKTFLLQKLMDVLRTEYSGVPFARVDFDSTRHRDPAHALTSVRLDLETNFRLAFPHFDLVRSVLAWKEGGAETELFQVGGSLRAVWSVVEAACSPSVGVARTVGAQALDALRRRYPRVEAKLRQLGGTEAVIRLRDMTPQDLVMKRLLPAFAKELCENLPSRDGRGCCGVLLLDTYEKLWTGSAGPLDPQGADNDLWVRALYEYLLEYNRVLLVIAGRDRLAWRYVDAGWREAAEPDVREQLDEHLVGGLSPRDTQRFLASCGVGPRPEVGASNALQRAIIRCAAPGRTREGCHPLLVGLCANIVVNHRSLHGTDPRAAVFTAMPAAESVPHVLAGTFLRSLSDPGLAELVTALSIPRWFDRHLIVARLGGGEDQSRAIWRTLCHFSFTDATGDGRLAMHGVMREALGSLVQTEDAPRIGELHQWYQHYWAQRWRAGLREAEAEAWFHWLHLEPGDAAASWARLAAEARRTADGPRIRELLAWWDGIDPRSGLFSQRTTGEAWALGLCDAADEMGWLPDFALERRTVFSRVMDLAAAALESASEVGCPSARARALHYLGDAHACLADLEYEPSGTITKAFGFLEDALELCSEAGLRDEWARVQVTVGNVYIDLPTGDRQSNLDKAVECLSAAAGILTPSKAPYDWVYLRASLGRAHACMTRADRDQAQRMAIAHYQEALRVAVAEGFADYLGTLRLNLAWAHLDLPTGNRLRNLHEAHAYLETAGATATRERSPYDWAWLRQMQGMLETALPLEPEGANLLRAIAFLREAQEVYTREEYARDWLATQQSLAWAWCRLPHGAVPDAPDRAIEASEAALSVCLPEENPVERALTQHLCGEAYAAKARRDGGHGIETALTYFQEAVGTLTEDQFPLEWARLQTAIGVATAARACNEPEPDLRPSIAHCEAALRVQDALRLPFERAETEYALARIRMLQGEPERSRQHLAWACEICPEIYVAQAALDFGPDTQGDAGGLGRPLGGATEHDTG